MEVVQGSVLDLPFAEESFDVVFSKDAIIHVADKRLLAAEIHRVLKSGGIFAASDWVGEYFGAEFQRVFTAIKRSEYELFQQQVTPLELQWYLKNA